MLQVESLGVDSLEELLDIVDKLWKESCDSTADTVMENFAKQFPFISLSPFYHRLIVEVISYELKRSVATSRPCYQDSHVSSLAPSSSSAPDISSHAPKANSSAGNVSPHTPNPSSPVPNLSSSTLNASVSASSHAPKSNSSAPDVISHAYLKEQSTDSSCLSLQDNISTEGNTIMESDLISQDNIITQENATTKTYTISEETTTTEANTCTQPYTITEADTISHGNHSVEGSFKCSLCDFVFRTEADLIIHKMRPHRYNLHKRKFLPQDIPRVGRLNPTFLCPHCADFVPYNERHKHMITHQIEHFKSEKLKSEMKEVFQG